MSKKEFEKQYPDAEKVDWKFDFADLSAPWIDGDNIMVADYWVRDEVAKTILLLSDKTVIDAERFQKNADAFAAQGLTVVNERPTKGYKVTRHKLTGAEVLSSDKWAGKYIPIIPVYGDEFDIEGKRYFRSLINGGKDPQRNFNF